VDPHLTVDRDVLTLARLARLLERACTDLDPPLTLAQYRLLAMIGDGADRASQIAGRLALTRPTVSATVDTLVERALVTREAADDDRRALRLQLTHAGAAALATAELAMRARLDDVLGRVDDRASVEGALASLGDGLDERRQERRAARAGAVRERE
jgi:DNA-binding MarR family transcriptional regulator